ncbi:MAG TPA: DUF3846 domain-containing protein [Candidatus Dormibacteraeota bacterium]|nr:DUF3846 domain-containing protein [Candidatus Dormibacteraeota bacterium]
MLFITEHGKTVDLTGEGIPSFEDVQQQVGGFVVVVELPAGYRGHHWMMIDEDGLLRQRPVNRTASAIAQEVIAGPALLATSAERRKIL